LKHLPANVPAGRFIPAGGAFYQVAEAALQAMSSAEFFQVIVFK